MGMFFGASAGFLIDEPQVFGMVYTADASVAVFDPGWNFDSPRNQDAPAPVLLTLTSGAKSSPVLASETAQALVNRFKSYASTSVESYGIVLDSEPRGT